MTLYELARTPEGRIGTLLIALEGWIDAGFGAAHASATIVDQMRGEPVALFDTDVLLDHRARRPVMRLIDGVNTHLEWPQLRMSLGADKDGKEFLFLHGAEPDSRWRAFCGAIGDLTRQFEIERIIGLGAYPAGTPHTRPVRMSLTANSAEVADQYDGFTRGSLEVPAGVQAAVERHAADIGLDAIGVWAQVPHYASGMAYPAASAALVGSVSDIAGLRFDLTTLQDEAAQTRAKLDRLVGQSDEHTALVEQLETAYDADEPTLEVNPQDLPSGDQIAADFQAFLRDQDDD